MQVDLYALLDTFPCNREVFVATLCMLRHNFHIGSVPTLTRLRTVFRVLLSLHRKIRTEMATKRMRPKERLKVFAAEQVRFSKASAS